MTVGKALDLMMLPLMGSLWMYSYAELFFRSCYPVCEANQPKWDLPLFQDYYCWLFIPSQLLAGFASYVVLSDRPDVVQPPVIAYSVTLFFHWVHYPLQRTSIHWSLADAVITTLTASYTAKLFYDVKGYCGFLMGPLVLLLIHQSFWDGWCYKAHKKWTGNFRIY